MQKCILRGPNYKNLLVRHAPLHPPQGHACGSRCALEATSDFFATYSDSYWKPWIRDWIGRQDVLLPINQNYNKIWETNKPLIVRWMILKCRYECWKTQQFTQQSVPQRCTQDDRYCPITSMVVHCPINWQIGPLIANHVRVFCYSFDVGMTLVWNKWSAVAL